MHFHLFGKLPGEAVHFGKLRRRHANAVAAHLPHEEPVRDHGDRHTDDDVDQPDDGDDKREVDEHAQAETDREIQAFFRVDQVVHVGSSEPGA